MFESLALDQSAYSDRTFDSWEQGWRSLLLRRYTYHHTAEDIVVPPVAEQTISLLLRGESDAESRSDGRWRSAHSVPGLISMTAPDRSSRLRWRTVSPEPLENIHLYLPATTTDRVVEELWDRDPRRVDFPDTLATTDPVLGQSMLGLMRAAEGGVPDLYAETAVEFLTVHLLVQHGRLPAPRPGGTDDERVRRARAFVRDNLHLPLSLAAIAAEVGLSRYHFLRVFQRQTGETPHRYLTRLRMDHARHELAHGSAPIGDIANRTGFASPAHFSTAFRRETGTSPSAYRRDHTPGRSPRQAGRPTRTATFRNEPAT